MTVVWALLFILLVVICWSLNLIGLPGNWMILLVSVVYAWLTSETVFGGMRWTAIAILIGLAIFGEVVEFGASATVVKRVGGSRTGAVLALLGSVIGAVTGLFVGVPIPIVGSVIAALLFAGLGAFLGALLGELTVGRSFEASWDVGWAAFWGRIFGTVAKTLVGAVMAGVAIAIVFV